MLSTAPVGSFGPAEEAVVESCRRRSQSIDPDNVSMMANLSHRERRKGITASHGRTIVYLSAHLDCCSLALRRLLDCGFACC